MSAIGNGEIYVVDEDELWMRSTEIHADKLTRFVDQVIEADDRGECVSLDFGPALSFFQFLGKNLDIIVPLA